MVTSVDDVKEVDWWNQQPAMQVEIHVQADVNVSSLTMNLSTYMTGDAEFEDAILRLDAYEDFH